MCNSPLSRGHAPVATPAGWTCECAAVRREPPGVVVEVARALRRGSVAMSGAIPASPRSVRLRPVPLWVGAQRAGDAHTVVPQWRYEVGHQVTAALGASSLLPGSA